MGEVDAAFIQEAEHRPNPEIIKAEGIPTIDLSHASTEKIVEEIRNACRDWGFFQVINHGVPSETRRKLEAASKEFFGQPLEKKRKIRRDEKKVLGYYDTEHTKNVRDWKEVFDFSVEDPTFVPDDDLGGVSEWHNQWPQHPSYLRKACEEYAKEVEKLAYNVMELIAMSLGLKPDRFHGFFNDQHTSFVRLNHYPPCPVPHLALGVGRHKDAGALTVLAQDDVGGLEVKRKSDGEWVWVQPTSDAYIVNVGDIIQVWSNEAYESVEHRVMVNSERERFSIPFFFNPSHSTVVQPLEELLKNTAAKYRPYNWGKFFVTRKASNFKKLNVENIQISHFRVVGSEI